MASSIACGPRPIAASANGSYPGPASAGEAARAAGAVLKIELDASGELRVNGARLRTPDELAYHLERARSSRQSVAVEVSPGASLAALTELLSRLRAAQVDRLGLHFVPLRSEGPRSATSPSASGSPSESAQRGQVGSLPELVVRTVGLHVGGGPNDLATRAAFRQPLEGRFDDFRRCYQLVDTPGQGGTFGADLVIGRQGGTAQATQPRATLGGLRFQECMLRAFSKASFPKPPAGGKVVSYSVRFSLEERHRVP